MAGAAYPDMPTGSNEILDLCHKIAFEQSDDAIFITNAQGRCLAVNSQGSHLTDCLHEELIGIDLLEIFLPDPDQPAIHLPELIQGKTSIFAGQIHRKDDTVFRVECRIKKVSQDSIMLVMRGSATEQNFQLTWTEQEARYQQAIDETDTGHLGLWEYDIANDRFSFNDQFYKIFRTTAKEVGGYTMSAAEYAARFIHPDDRHLVAHEVDKAIATSDPHFCGNLEHRILYPDGATGYISVEYFAIKDESGKTVKTYGINQDITEQKRAEQERLANLKYFESMEKVNSAIQGAKDFEQMMRDLLDTVLAVFDCDRAYLAYPCDPEAAFFRVPMERNKPEFPGAFQMGIDIPMNSELAQAMQEQLDTDGPIRAGAGMPHILSEKVAEQFGIKTLMATAVYPTVDKPWQFGIQQCSFSRQWTLEEEHLFREISRRLADALSSMLANNNLRESERFLNNVVENIPDMIFIKDAEELKYVRLNKAGEVITGFSREELSGKNDYDFFPEKMADFFIAKDREVLSTRALVDIPQETIRTKSNEERILHTKKIPILDENGKPQFLLGISEDITEHKRLENQLHQALKMEAVGRLAGGIAHDFNNMLGVIIGNAELALLQADKDQPLSSNLEKILNAAGRSADLTRQLLGFARKQTISPKLLDLNKTVAGMFRMLEPLLGEDIDLVWRPGSGECPVKIDPTQVDQILANLAVNARDAITGVGKITIETAKVSFDEKYCCSHQGFIPGDFAMLAVSDNGQGMDRATQSKIFEPFFTTKDQDKGTGLGLATIYGIVKQNNGFINVYSEPGHGSIFKIYLPCHSVVPVALERKQNARPEMRGDETILLLEDEADLLDMGRQMLESIGYHVLAAATPGEALSIARTSSNELHLLITDVVMPEMNGRDLANKMAEIFPDIKQLFMSGYTGNVIAHHGVLDEGVHFIQKPFSIEDLADKVRKVLDS